MRHAPTTTRESDGNAVSSLTGFVAKRPSQRFVTSLIVISKGRLYACDSKAIKQCEPEYFLPENLERLRSRGLGAKRRLRARDSLLGIEALGRFVRKKPLRRTHKCVFGVFALESEPVDPRL